MIVGDKITVEIPYNTSLKGATVEYALCEGASINPNPSTIEDWENEWKFVVTSKMQDSKVYSYTYQYTDIEQSGSVVLATQAEVDNFCKDRNKQNRRQPDHRNGRRRRNHQSGRTCQPETNQ